MEKISDKISIGIIDDQRLFVKSLCTLISTFPSFTVIVDAINGEDLIKKFNQPNLIPDILLIDVNMPVMEGPELATIISHKFPTIKMVALSMKDDDITIIKMLRAGCSAFLIKDIEPGELEKALLEVNQKGYYNADMANINYRRLMKQQDQTEEIKLSEREKVFIQLACSDLTYKQIASEMNLSVKTVDGYRMALFQKMNVQSRVGMALEAIRKNYAYL